MIGERKLDVQDFLVMFLLVMTFAGVTYISSSGAFDITGAATSTPELSVKAIANGTQCGEVNGSVTLTTDVTSNASCFNINASDVTIDCAGFQVVYAVNGIANSNGVNNSLGYDNVTVKNCRIVDGNSTGGTQRGIFYSMGDKGVIFNNTINTTGSVGIEIADGTNHTNISFNNVVSDDYGIFVYTSSTNSIVDDNTVNATGTYAILVHSVTHHATIRRNYVRGLGIGTWGLTTMGFSMSTNYTVEHNVVTTNGSVAALYLSDMNDSTYFNNTITALFNGTNGVYVTSSTNVSTFINNNITSNNSFEIYDDTGEGTVNYLIFNNSFGQITWLDNGTGGFLKNLSVNVTNNQSFGLGNNIQIDNNTIAFNASAFKSQTINATVNLSFYNLNTSLVTHIFRLHNFSDNSTFIRDSGTDCYHVECARLYYHSFDITFNATSLGSFMVNGSSGNTAPNTTSVVVNSSSQQNITNDNLYCWVNTEDDEQTHLAVNWTLYKDGVTFSNGKTLIPNGTLTNLTTIPQNSTGGGQNWTCRVQVSDGIVNETDFNNASLLLADYACGDNVTASSSLTANLSFCDNLGLTINTENIEFDCKGYSIIGSNRSWGLNVTKSGNSHITNVTVKNCYVSNFAFGLHIWNTSNSTFLNNTFQGPMDIGIYQKTGLGNWIVNNTVTHTNSTYMDRDFYAPDAAIFMERNGVFGAIVEINFNHTVEGNNLSHNRPGGINLYSPNQYRNNYLFNNTFGYYVGHLGGNLANANGGIIAANITGDIIKNSTYGVQFNYSPTTNITMTNVIFDNNTNNFFDTESNWENDFYLVNATVNTDNVNASSFYTIYLRWYVDVNVTNSSGTPVVGASVEGYDSQGTWITNETTGTDGIARLELTEMYRKNKINYILTPTTIKVKGENRTRNSTTATLRNATYFVVNLSSSLISCGSNLYADGDFNPLNCDDTAFSVGGAGLTFFGNNITGNGTGIGWNISSRMNTHLLDFVVQNFSTAISLQGTNHINITRATVNNNTYGIMFNESSNNTILDSLLFNNSFDIFAVGGNSTNFLYNVTVDLDNITINGSSTVNKGWVVDVNITINDANAALGGAIVSGYWANGSLDSTATTKENGMARLYLSELKKNGSGVFYLTNHTINVSYVLLGESYVNTTNINLSETNNTQVGLHMNLNCTTPSVGLDINADTTFCPGTYKAHLMTVSSSNVRVSCNGTYTTIEPASQFWVRGIDIGQLGGFNPDTKAENVTLEYCTFKGFSTAIRIWNSKNTTIFNNTIVENADGISCWKSDNVNISNNYIAGSSGSTESPGIQLNGCQGTLISNNTFSSNVNDLYLKEYSWNNPPNSHNITLFHNTFLGAAQYYFNTAEPSNHSFNISANISGSMTAQGNQWDDYCGKGKDTNSDGYADAEKSTGAGDWPYNKTVSSGFLASNTNPIDYGPKVHACVSEVQLGSSSGSSSSTVESGGSAPPAAAEGQAAAASVSAPSAAGSSVYTPEDTKKFLKAGQEAAASRLGEGIIGVKVILENTGDRPMSLFPQISAETDEPFFIVTRKTLGFEGSRFERLSGISYSDTPISGRLLEATLLNPEEIVLQPGEKIEKLLEIKEGFSVPRQLKIQFTTVGETVLEKDVEVEQKSVSGTAVDVDTDANLVDIYALLVPVSKDLEEHYSDKDEGSKLTGAASSSLSTSTQDQFMIELALDKIKFSNEKNRLPIRFLIVEKLSSVFDKSSTTFSDLYGPYALKEDQTFIFAQQLGYNPNMYAGDHLLKTKIYRNGDVIVDNEFEVQLGKSPRPSTTRSLGLWLISVTVFLLLLGEGIYLLARSPRDSDDF